MSRLLTELRRKYRTPHEAIRRLGIDAALLDDPAIAPETITAQEALAAILHLIEQTDEAEYDELRAGLGDFLEQSLATDQPPHEHEPEIDPLTGLPLTGETVVRPSLPPDDRRPVLDRRRPAMDSRSPLAARFPGLASVDTGDHFAERPRKPLAMDGASKRAREVNRAERARRTASFDERFPGVARTRSQPGF